MFNKFKIYFFICFASQFLSITHADGIVEHHKIISQILADARQVSTREISIYLPEDYVCSNKYYPTLYLLHGATGTNRTFLGSGYSNTYMTGVKVNLIVDRLIDENIIKPLIIVLPNMNRSWGRKLDPYDNYFVEELMPFIDENYRTIKHRNARAIIGHSEGGHGSLHIAFSHPELFSQVGGYSSYSPGGALPNRNVIISHDNNAFFLQFWLYAGLNDHFDPVIPGNRDLVESLKTANLPYTYIEDTGDHFNKIPQRLEESIIYFSEKYIYEVDSIKSQGNLIDIWERMK